MRSEVSDFDPPAKAPADAGAVTRLLAAAREGDSAAPGRLFEIVYADLRALAGRHVRGARNAGPSATSLVHEAFLRIAKRGDLPYADRTHFFAVASRAMRQRVRLGRPFTASTFCRGRAGQSAARGRSIVAQPSASVFAGSGFPATIAT